MGAKKRLNGTSKVNTRTDGQTDGQTDEHTDMQTDILTYRKESAQRADALKTLQFLTVKFVYYILILNAQNGVKFFYSKLNIALSSKHYTFLL